MVCYLNCTQLIVSHNAINSSSNLCSPYRQRRVLHAILDNRSWNTLVHNLFPRIFGKIHIIERMIYCDIAFTTIICQVKQVLGDGLPFWEAVDRRPFWGKINTRSNLELQNSQENLYLHWSGPILPHLEVSLATKGSHPCL